MATLRMVAPAPTTSRERGLREVAKADRHLEAVAKSSYRRRTVRDPGSELDVIAAAQLMLNASRKRRLPQSKRKQLHRELQMAIARGYLNAPYTAGF